MRKFPNRTGIDSRPCRFLVLVVILALVAATEPSGQPWLEAVHAMPGTVWDEAPEQERPRFVRAGHIGGRLDSMATAGEVAFVGTGPHVLSLDLSNPASPRQIGQIELPISRILRLRVVMDRLYVLANGSRIWIVDIADPAVPTALGNFEVLGGVRDLDVQQQRAYLVLVDHGLKIFDVTDPGDVQELGSGYVLPRNQVIEAEGDHVYLGGYDGLTVIDVGDVLRPQRLAMIEEVRPTGERDEIHQVGEYIVVSYGQGLKVIDVSDPANPSLQWSLANGSVLSTGGDAALREDGRLFVMGDGLLLVLDLSDPSQPRLLEQRRLVEPDQVNLIELLDSGRPVVAGISGNILVLGTPEDPLAIHGEMHLPAILHDVVTWQDLAFVQRQGIHQHDIVILDISDPATPVMRGRLAAEDMESTRWPQIDGDRLYTVATEGVGRSAILIHQLDADTVPRLLGRLDLDVQIRHLVIQGDVGLAVDPERLHALDFGNPAAARLVDSIELPDWTTDMALHGGRAYLVRDDGLWVVDVSDPSQMQSLEIVEREEIAEIEAVAGQFILTFTDGGFGYFDAEGGPRQLRVVNGARIRGLVAAGDKFLGWIPEGIVAYLLRQGAPPTALVEGGEIRDWGRSSLSGDKLVVAGVEQGLGIWQGDWSEQATPTAGTPGGGASSTPTEGTPGGGASRTPTPGTPGTVGPSPIRPSPTLDPGATQGPTATPPSPTPIVDPSATPTVTPPPIGADTGVELTVLGRLGGGETERVACADDWLASVLGSSLITVNASDPEDLRQLGTLDLRSDSVERLILQDDLLLAAAGPEGLLAIDVSDPSRPRVVASVVLDGSALDVAVSGGLAYVAAGEAGLQIVDVSDPARPRMVGSWPLRGRSALRVLAAGSRVFLATDAGELAILDASLPAAPLLLDSLDLGAPPRDLVLHEDLLYLLGDDGHLRLIELDGAGAPRPIDIEAELGEGFNLAMSGDLLVMDRAGDAAWLLDVTNPRQPEAIGSVFVPQVGAWIWSDIQATADRLCAAMGGRGLVAVDIRLEAGMGQPDHLNWYARDTIELNLSAIRAVATEGGRGLLIDRDFQLRAFDLGRPEAPIELARLDPRGLPMDLAARGDLAFAAMVGRHQPDGGDRGGGLRIYDLSAADPLTAIGMVDSEEWEERQNERWSAVAVEGDWVYVGTSSGLAVIEASNPRSPRVVATLDLGGASYQDQRDIALAGDYAYLPQHNEGIHVIDLRLPASPRLVATLPMEQDATEIRISGDRAVVSAARIQVYDLSDPAAPRLLSQAALGASEATSALAWFGSHILVGAAGQPLAPFDVSQPGPPRRVPLRGLQDPVHDLVPMGEYWLAALGEGGVAVLGVERLRQRHLYLPVAWTTR